MRAIFASFFCVVAAGCAGPDIDDWPPEAPPVSDAVIQSYVDRYAGLVGPPPEYDADDLKALSIVLDRRARMDDEDTPGTYAPPPPDFGSDARERSRGEINAIKRRVRRKYESNHDRRHELRRYGL